MATKRKSRKNNKSKRKQIFPPTLIVGGIFFVMILLIILAVINVKVNNLKKDLKIEKTTNNYIKQIEKDIKVIFFDLEIDKNYVQHKVIKKNNKFILTYSLKLNKNDVDTVFYNIGNFLKKENFKITYFDDNELNAENKFLKIIFKISKLKTPKAEKIIKSKIAIKHENNKQKKLSIIIDDCGNNLKLAKKLASLPYPLTMSIIPFLRYSKETVKIAKQHNKTVFLHFPMQPKSYPNTDPGKGAIFLNTPKSLIEVIVKQNVENLGNIDGANNHMGSALTENRKKMYQVLSSLKKYTNTFVDSHTSAHTVAYDVCKSLKMRCGINRKFIDNIEDKEYIRKNLYELLKLFDKYNKIIIIGHLKEKTIQVLEEELPNIQQQGIKISNLKEVLD